MKMLTNDEQESEILRASGYEHIRSKRLYSMSLKEYLETVQNYVVKAVGDEPAKEIAIVNEMIQTITEQQS